MDVLALLQQSIDLVQRQPDDLAWTIAAVAMCWLSESVGQLPFLRFVAPLRGRVGDDVVGVAVAANRGRSCGSRHSPLDVLGQILLGQFLLGQILFRMKRIEK
jgi:hypothetical protein